MALCQAGLTQMIESGSVVTHISKNHPLIKLANSLPWEKIYGIISLDLIRSLPSLNPFQGRRLWIRIHLGVYILQSIFKWSDRQTELYIKICPLFQMFCGKGILPQFHVPDHTKIEEFRNRLDPDTQREIANFIAQEAAKRGYADPRTMDIDSTVQEALIRPSSEIYLLERLAFHGKKILYYLNTTVPGFINKVNVPLSMKYIRGISKSYLLYSKGEGKEKAKALIKIKKHIMPAIIFIKCLTQIFFYWEKQNLIPWNILDSFKKIQNKFIPLLCNVNYFIKRQVGEPKRILSIHLDKVAIFVKGRNHWQKVKYGRQYQIGRIGGNYCIIGESFYARNSDKTALKEMIEEHQILFGKDTLESFVVDRGYYSKENEEFLEGMNLKEFFLPKPGIPEQSLSEQDRNLYSRRAGIEPLIGHIKAGGCLGKSNAHTDTGMEAQAYRSVLGFNLRQFSRDIVGEKRFTKVLENS